MVIAALEVDCEGPVAGYHRGWDGNLSASFNYSGNSRFDVFHQPVGTHYRLLCFTQGRTHTYEPAARQRGGTRVAEASVRLAEVHAFRCGVCGAHRVYVLGHYLEILNLHGFYLELTNVMLRPDIANDDLDPACQGNSS